MLASHSAKTKNGDISEVFENLGLKSSTSVKLSEKTVTNEEDLSFSGTPSLSSEEMPELFFEKETSIPDFEREPVYELDRFEKSSLKVEKMLTPPPDFKAALSKLPESIQENFKRILNADIVGIWPIKNDVLLNKR